VRAHPSLLEQMPEEEWSMMDDMSFDGAGGRLGGGGLGRKGKENLPG